MTERHTSGRPAPLPILAGIVVLIVVTWFTFQYLSEQLRQPGCVNPVAVEIAAEPAIAPALAEVAAALDATAAAAAGDGSRSAADCYRLNVVSQESATVADRLTGVEAGLQPDVWVPDSTFWLRRVRAGGAIELPEAGASLATSPVVLAVAEPAARRLGWPQRPLTWADVIGATPAADALRVALPDPARNPVGLAALFGVRAMTEPAAAQVAALRRLSANVTARAGEPFDLLAPAYDPGAIATAVTAFPATEQAVLRHNNTNPQQPLVPVYAEVAVPALDYPYVVLPTTVGIERTGAERFLEALLDRDALRAVRARGLRTPRGEAGADFPGPFTGPAALAPAPLPDQATANDVLRVWTAVNLSARILTVVDISGSMNAQVPGTGRTRAQLTAEAAMQGLGLFKDTTDMGLWVFSNNLDGERDHRELAPIGPMSTQRANLIALAGQVPGMVGGKTNLFDTLLAAYTTVQQGWDAARLNLVLVLTDGRDDDVSSIDGQQVVTELTRLQDPRKPVRIIFVGLGPDVDAAELDRIAAVTGGRAFTSPDPAGIRTVFAAALAELTCIPPACTPRR